MPRETTKNQQGHTIHEYIEIAKYRYRYIKSGTQLTFLVGIFVGHFDGFGVGGGGLLAISPMHVATEKHPSWLWQYLDAKPLGQGWKTRQNIWEVQN